ncbi:hypothetical protein [Cystobacter fuscus]|uniref:hypothetical protein n=1 Tax=Cystobacter fuscus TaxID=43 RepID=UPI000BB37315|nr:hypothetical protein [Cystobacter fuscus]
MVDSHLDVRLASEAVREDMRRIARMLPPVLGFQFECRLGSPASRVDLLPRLLLTDGSCDALLGLGDTPPTLPEVARDHPTWRALGDFCREWRKPGGALNTGVMDVFLEFDLDHPPPEVPEPCVFMDFARPVRQTREFAERGLDLLLGDRLPASTRRRLAACYEALPPEARIYSVGVMFPRGTSALRLCLSGASLPRWLSYLERIGWPGQPGEVEAALGRLPELADQLSLDIDVGETLGEKVGFEFAIQAPIGSSQPRWETLLGHLVERGLGLPDKREAILAWVGHMQQRSQPESWPKELSRIARELNGRGLSLFLRRLSHLKVVHQPGRPLEAKVYLETLHRWLHYSDAQQGYVLDDDAPRGV